jgi:hypothetical protein
MRAVAVFVAVFTASGATTTFAQIRGDPVEYGTYACVTQRLVGHQTSEPDKVRRSGQIRPPTDRFLVTIEKIKRESSEICDPTQPFTSLNKAPRTYEWWWECDSKNKATFSKGKSPAITDNFRSDAMNVFLDELGVSSFWVTGKGEYRLVYDNFGGDHYLEEGVCQRMK